MTADLNAAANQLTADIMAEVEASDWLRGRLAAAWDAGYDRRGDAMAAFGKSAPFHLRSPNPYRGGAS